MHGNYGLNFPQHCQPTRVGGEKDRGHKVPAHVSGNLREREREREQSAEFLKFEEFKEVVGATGTKRCQGCLSANYLAELGTFGIFKFFQ